MNLKYITAELREAGASMGRSRQSKGSMGKIRQHAKKYGEEAFKKLIADLDTVTDRSREWNEGQKDLFWRTVLEEIQKKLNKELQ